jgi:hypothetical protein
MSQNMKTKSEHAAHRRSERGNALVYVLIAIVLFAALSFAVSRQSDTSEAGGLDAQKAELYATELITYAANAKQALDKMEFSGANPDFIDFTVPADTAFNTAPTTKKIYHPDGGGFNQAALPDKVAASGVANPAPGWYMGRFNDVEWTALGPLNTAGAGGTEAPYQDTIITAYGIAEPVCADINQKITGNKTIPVVTESLKNILVPKTVGGVTNFTAGANVNLTTDPINTTPPPICPDCHNRGSLCIQEGGIFAFYSVISER